MSTLNPFDLLGDDDNDDPSQLIQKKLAEIKPKETPVSVPTAKLPTKPLPPSQAVKEAKEARSGGAPTRGGAARGGGFRGRGGRGNWSRDSENGGFGGGGGGVVGGGEEGVRERERGPRGPYRGGRRGGYGYGGGRGENGNGGEGGDGERVPRRIYERRSGTGHGNEMKREGAGRGNWGTPTDEIAAGDKEGNGNGDDVAAVTEKPEELVDVLSADVIKEAEAAEVEGKEEDKELTLEEYEKIREEKRKALLALKSEERKVEIDKELQSMQQLSSKKENHEIFVKLGSDKDSGKKKEAADREEKNKKAVNINDIFKPAEGERYRGRGRGRGERGGYRGGYGGGRGSAAAPSIEDPGQFPTLGGK